MPGQQIVEIRGPGAIPARNKNRPADGLLLYFREPLQGGFEKLVREGRQVAEASQDFLQELKLP